MDIEPGLFHKFDSTAVENIIEPKVGKHQMGSRDRVQAQGLRSSSGTGAILPRRKTIMPPSMSGSPLSTRRHRRDSDAARSTAMLSTVALSQQEKRELLRCAQQCVQPGLRAHGARLPASHLLLSQTIAHRAQLGGHRVARAVRRDQLHQLRREPCPRDHGG